mgnify:CR=1 FL=1
MAAALVSVCCSAGSPERRFRFVRMLSSLGNMRCTSGNIWPASPIKVVAAAPGIVSKGAKLSTGFEPSRRFIVTPPISASTSSLRVPRGTPMFSFNSMRTTTPLLLS